MSLLFSFGKLTSNQSVGVDLPKPETPFRIAVLGDFSGRGARGEQGSADDIGRRRPRKVDRASLDEVMAKLAPQLRLPIGPKGKASTLAFQTLDDFHPDGLHARIEAFQDLYGAEEKGPFLNQVLHDPAFQALEATWRGLDWLLQGVARHKAVEVRLIDLSFEELLADLSAAEELEASGLYQLLVDVPAQRADADPWSVFVGNYLFDLSGPHVEALGRIAKIARQASAPFLTGVAPRVHAPSFALDDDEEAAWSALRRLPETALLGLATPRFLLRPPFGENTKTIDAFEFEEYTGEPGWNHYLWGNAALACARLLAESFGKDGWSFKPGAQLDLGGMALHVTRDEDDEPRSTLAEAWLTSPIAQRLSGQGLMPLLCVKGRDSVQLACIQSLASPAKGQPASPLLGRWNQSGSVTLPRSTTGGAVPTAPAAAAPSPSAPPTPQGPAPATAPERPRHSGVLPDSDFSTPPPLTERPTVQYVGVLADTVNSDEINSPVVWPESTGAAAPNEEEEVDPELAALMADLDGGTEAEEEMDPELAALMADLDGTPEPAADEPVEEEMDPELAALMAELDGTAALAAAEPVEEEMDPELAALMAELDGTAAPAAAEPAEEEMDPELAALMRELDGSPEEES